MPHRDGVIALDRRSAFVRAVDAVRAGNVPIDHAVDVLLEIEARCGVAVHTDFGGLAGILEQGPWRLRPPHAPLPLGDLIGPDSRIQATPDNVAERYDLSADDLSDTEYRVRLFPFLSETQLLLSGMDFTNFHFLTLGEEIVASFWSQRMWAQVLVDWADWSSWAARHGVAVSYADFYFSGSQLIEDYAAFKETALACIRRKTIRLVGSPLPPWSGDPRVLRAWKIALRDAGKERVLAVLAPAVLEALAEIRTADVGEPRHRARHGDPRERAAAAARAVDALRTRGPSAEVEIFDRGDGLIPPAAECMRAAAALVDAMKAKAKFASSAMSCLWCLSVVRPDLVERVAAEL